MHPTVEQFYKDLEAYKELHRHGARFIADRVGTKQRGRNITREFLPNGSGATVRITIAFDKHFDDKVIEFGGSTIEDLAFALAYSATGDLDWCEIDPRAVNTISRAMRTLRSDFYKLSEPWYLERIHQSHPHAHPPLMEYFDRQYR